MTPAARTAPFAPYEWAIALRYLRARRREGFISIIAGFSFLGIMLGVATLIIVMAVMNGFRAELLDKILGFDGHFTAYAIGEPVRDYDAMAERFAEVAGVRRVIPYVRGQVMVSSPRSATGALVRGMSEADVKSLESVNNERLRGSLDGFDGRDVIAIGQRMALQHGLGIGDVVNLISPRGPVTPLGVTPRIQPFEIAAIFQMGMSEYDNSIIFMPMTVAQDYFVEEGASAIEIMVERPDEIERYIHDLQRTGGARVQLVSWKSANQTFFNALQVERNVMFLILTLIILVAAFNIVSGLIMLVKDKSSDIAILRSMGTTRAAVMRIFFITGAAIGLIGTMAGLALGLVVCANIEEIRQGIASLTGTELFSPEVYYLSQLPAEVDIGETAAIVFMSLGLSFLATLYPSWRAARLDPVEALRYE